MLGVMLGLEKALWMVMVMVLVLEIQMALDLAKGLALQKAQDLGIVLGNYLAAQLGHLYRTVDIFQTLGTSPLRKVIEKCGYSQSTNPKGKLVLLTPLLLNHKTEEDSN